MTIEIRQLVIRAVVEQKAEQVTPSDVPRPRGAADSPRRAAPSARAHVLDRDALVADCARLVLRELRKERER